MQELAFHLYTDAPNNTSYVFQNMALHVEITNFYKINVANKEKCFLKIEKRCHSWDTDDSCNPHL